MFDPFFDTLRRCGAFDEIHEWLRGHLPEMIARRYPEEPFAFKDATITGVEYGPDDDAYPKSWSGRLTFVLAKTVDEDVVTMIPLIFQGSGIEVSHAACWRWAGENRISFIFVMLAEEWPSLLAMQELSRP